MSDDATHRDVPSYEAMTLERLLDAFSEASPAPGGGGAAVLAVALSASLCAMAARLSTGHVDDAPEIAAEALSIRDRIVPMCAEDADAYLAVIAARRLDADHDKDHGERRRRVGAALSAATDGPVAIVVAGARLARLAARLAEEGNPNLRGDALAAAVLAGAGVEAAATLARINLAGFPGDDRIVVVRDELHEATAQVDRARRAVATLG
jgi:formiminotetrahydrofolate cyclodeaminase